MPWETSMLPAVQRRTAGPRTPPVARLLSRAGEHAAAWMAAGCAASVTAAAIASGRLPAPSGRTGRGR